MKKLTFTFACALAFSLAIPSHKSRADGPPKGSTPEEIFKWADKNGDGKVTPDELPNAETFAKFDLNKDGTITIEEARQVLTAMQQKLGGAKTAAEDTTKAGGNGGRLENLLQRFLDRRGKAAPAPDATGSTPAVPIVQGPKPIKPGDVGVGRQVADFAFTTLDGKARKLSDWKSQAGLAISFTSTTCPVSKRYAPSLARLEKELHSRNIALLLVNPFASEKPEDIAAKIKDLGLTAPYVHDVNKAVTHALNARTTTEVFLLDTKRTLIYRGALDDQYGASHNLDAPRESYLLDAATAMLAGARPIIAATEAPGCELDIPSSAAAAKTQVTYHRDVARILQQNCVQCHHDKGIAPFALDDLADVTDRAKTIQRVIEDRVMPPWSAAPIAEGQPNPWANDHSLSNQDKADLLTWIGSADRPLGNPVDAPAPLKFSDGWNFGEPDLIVQIPQPIAVKAEGFMPYQVATVETTLADDKWVQAYEILPTAREVVHHVIVQVHEKGARIKRGGEEGDGGYWAAYVPGNSGRVYPEGFARKLPAGATISFQIHYTPNWKGDAGSTPHGPRVCKAAAAFCDAHRGSRGSPAEHPTGRGKPRRDR